LDPKGNPNQCQAQQDTKYDVEESHNKSTEDDPEVPSTKGKGKLAKINDSEAIGMN